MNGYVLNNFGIPILVAVISGLVVLIIWKYNSIKSERKKIYLPLLNKLSRSLAELQTIIDRNYPYAFSRNSSVSLINNEKTSAEFINLPKKLRKELVDIPSKVSNYLNILNSLISKVAPLESYVRHRPYGNNIQELYVINFVLCDSPPSSDLVINFPMKSAGGFHSLFCEKSIAERIYNEAKYFTELSQYKTIKSQLTKDVSVVLSKVTKLQNI